MPNATEIAVTNYIRAWSEPDPAARAALIDRFFAEDGRLLTGGREYRGRAALAEMMTRVLADPQLESIRILSPIDAQGALFRFRAAVLRRDGSAPESFDAGHVDANGQISVLLTFAGPPP